MPLDPQLEPLVTAMAAQAAAAPIESQTVDEARAGLGALSMLLGDKAEVSRVDDIDVDGPGGTIPVRVYTPGRAGPFGALVYFHGGGFVIGDLDTHDHLCRELALGAGCVVVSVDYRRAPEHPFPAAVDDCWAALQWVIEEGPTISIDTDRLAVGGDSAGGNLAAVVARRARDEGEPDLALQLLVYPVTDLRPDNQWPSRTTNASGYLLTSDLMDWFGAHYLPDPSDAADPDASPLVADDLAGVAPAFVVLAEYDPLHDEGLAYAEKLAAAGVETDVRDFAGAVHLFFQLGPIADIGRRAVDEAAAAVREALAG
jgi:acetyl esterase